MTSIETKISSDSVTVVTCNESSYKLYENPSIADADLQYNTNEEVSSRLERNTDSTRKQSIEESSKTSSVGQSSLNPVKVITEDTTSELSSKMSYLRSVGPNVNKNTCSDAITIQNGESKANETDGVELTIPGKKEIIVTKKSDTAHFYSVKSTAEASNNDESRNSGQNIDSTCNVDTTVQSEQKGTISKTNPLHLSDLTNEDIEDIKIATKNVNPNNNQIFGIIRPPAAIVRRKNMLPSFNKQNQETTMKSNARKKEKIKKTAVSNPKPMSTTPAVAQTNSKREAIVINSTENEKSNHAWRSPIADQKSKHRMKPLLVLSHPQNPKPVMIPHSPKVEQNRKTATMSFLRKKLKRKDKNKKKAHEMLQERSLEERDTLNSPRVLLVGKNGVTQLTEREKREMSLAPGTYNMSEIIGVTGRGPAEPKHAKLRINRSAWKSAVHNKNESGTLEVPEDILSSKIPVENATFDLLQFYACKLISPQSTQLSVNDEHVIEDLNYAPSHFKEQFERRGSGLETRNAVHIACPLSPMERSGLFLIGKWSKRQGAEDGYLCMTAFRVPQYHAVYIPEGTIHSDDFLQGSWKTILPTTAKEINRVRICAESSTDNEGGYLFNRHFVIDETSEDFTCSASDHIGKELLEFKTMVNPMSMLCCYDSFLPQLDDFTNKGNDGESIISAMRGTLFPGKLNSALK